ncbi:MAG: HD domain-containing protein [Pelomonas sp.]|nr:HD domain-containing protein [Roseateles sp.]
MPPPAVLAPPAPDARPSVLRLLPPAPQPADAPDLSAHRQRLGRLAEGLALRLGWDADRARQLRLAAPLHDVGEQATPAVADDTHGTRRLHAQPRRGAALLGGSSLPLFALAAEIALHHRERWDGNGYPHGLRGQEIPLAARIVAVVDYFDALTMPHSYRPARADDRALAMLAEQSGSAFDPALVAAFLAHAPDLIALRDGA